MTAPTRTRRARRTWTLGTRAAGARRHQTPAPRPDATWRAWLTRKRAAVAEMVQHAERAAALGGHRGDLPVRVAFQRSRLELLDWCLTASADARRARLTFLVRRVGPETVAAFHAGALGRADVTAAVSVDIAAIAILERVT